MNKHLNRRKFISNSTVLLGSVLPLSRSAFAFYNDSAFTASTKALAEKLLADISTMPNFCSHEHWGSIDSIGEAPAQNGFRCDTTAGALPLRPTSVWDLFLDPYEEGWLAAGERNPNQSAIAAGESSQIEWWKHSPQQALKKFSSLIDSSLMTGGFQCTRRGIQLLYGIDLESFEVADWKKADEAIAKNYTNPFNWYRQAMHKAHFTELIRPVHPEFYVWKDSAESKANEISLMRTVMRVDSLLTLWKPQSARRNDLAEIAGIDPVDAASWRAFITKLFDLAARNKAVGIKQMQAYRRTLEYLPRTDEEVTFRGDLDEAAVRKFEDWVMHECCKQAHERNWSHQVHVGTHNLKSSSPLPLQPLAVKYPRMNIVMIHCWPFLKEAGFLAKLNHNMYLDTCWLPVLNPEFLRDALKTWLNYVPAHKIMHGHDSTHVEMATGSSLFTREVLAEALAKQQKELKISDTSLNTIAADLLQNNAVRLYGFGNELKV